MRTKTLIEMMNKFGGYCTQKEVEAGLKLNKEQLNEMYRDKRILRMHSFWNGWIYPKFQFVMLWNSTKVRYAVRDYFYQTNMRMYDRTDKEKIFFYMRPTHQSVYGYEMSDKKKKIPAEILNESKLTIETILDILTIASNYNRGLPC